MKTCQPQDWYIHAGCDKLEQPRANKRLITFFFFFKCHPYPTPPPATNPKLGVPEHQKCRKSLINGAGTRSVRCDKAIGPRDSNLLGIISILIFGETHHLAKSRSPCKCALTRGDRRVFRLLIREKARITSDLFCSMSDRSEIQAYAAECLSPFVRDDHPSAYERIRTKLMFPLIPFRFLAAILIGTIPWNLLCQLHVLYSKVFRKGVVSTLQYKLIGVYCRIFSRVFLFMCGFRTRVHGKWSPNIDGRPVTIVCNHCSYWDTL